MMISWFIPRAHPYSAECEASKKFPTSRRKMKMDKRLLLGASVLTFILAIAYSAPVRASDSSIVTEKIRFEVYCGSATVEVAEFSVLTDNYTLIHFPSEADMSDSHLENATAVYVMGSTIGTFLGYTFENVTLEEARANADAVTPSMSAAFDVSFTWFSNYTYDSAVQILYNATGQSNLTSFAEWLTSTCVAEDVDGFSNVLPSLVTQLWASPENRPNLMVFVFAGKEAGSFNWLMNGIGFPSGGRPYLSIPPGSNSHTIDVLSLLGVSALSPSPYSFYTIGETEFSMSQIDLDITSEGLISFAYCEPPLAPTPGEKGWSLIETYPDYIHAMFGFGDDPSPVTQLSITFTGTVIPEFTPLTTLLTLMLAAASILALKKKLL